VRTFGTLLDPEPVVPGRLPRFLAPIPSVSLTSNLMDVLMALSNARIVNFRAEESMANNSTPLLCESRDQEPGMNEEHWRSAGSNR
jgi:hypothetical protein